MKDPVQHDLFLWAKTSAPRIRSGLVVNREPIRHEGQTLFAFFFPVSPRFSRVICLKTRKKPFARQCRHETAPQFRYLLLASGIVHQISGGNADARRLSRSGSVLMRCAHVQAFTHTLIFPPSLIISHCSTHGDQKKKRCLFPVKLCYKFAHLANIISTLSFASSPHLLD